MGYDRKVTEIARAKLERRRQQAESIAAEKLLDFHQRCPRAEEIKYQLAANAAGAAKAVLSGGNARELLEKRREHGLALSAEYDRLLGEHGLTRNDIEPQYACPHCKDTGFVDGKMCQCYRQLRKSIAYRQLSSELPLERCTFGTFSLDYYKNDERASAQMPRVLEACKNYAQRFRAGSSSMLFWGGTGLGKTHLSLAIANVAVDRGFGVVYGTAQSFAVALEKERFDRDLDDGSATIDSLKDCDLLILDDLGTELTSAYVSAAIYDVLNARLMAGRPTIVSTNLSISGIEERYGQRLASRIAGSYGMLEFRGKDVRIAKRTGSRKTPANPNGS